MQCARQQSKLWQLTSILCIAYQWTTWSAGTWWGYIHLYMVYIYCIYGIYLYLYMRWLVMYEIPSHFIHLAKICFNCNVTFEIRADESSATIKTQTSYNWRLRWRRMQFELDRGGLQKTVFNWKNFSRQLVNNWVISRPLSVCFLFRTSEDSQSSRLD